MSHNIIEIEGAAGKTVQKITITNEWDFRMITVRFADRTAIHFSFGLGLTSSQNSLTGKPGMARS
jgi:hypothetical protein